MPAKTDPAQTTEPAITINRIALTDAQAMTVRVAVENFAIDLATHGLGDDGHGRTMTNAYLARIAEIREAINAR